MVSEPMIKGWHSVFKSKVIHHENGRWTTDANESADEADSAYDPIDGDTPAFVACS